MILVSYFYTFDLKESENKMFIIEHKQQWRHYMKDIHFLPASQLFLPQALFSFFVLWAGRCLLGKFLKPLSGKKTIIISWHINILTCVADILTCSSKYSQFMSFSVNQLINSHLKTRIPSKRDMILLNLQRKSTRTEQLTIHLKKRALQIIVPEFM